MRLTKTTGAAGALILSALVGGTLIGSALATDGTTGTDATGVTAEYCEIFTERFASELGVTREAVVTAGRSAATTAIDTAVAAGTIAARTRLPRSNPVRVSGAGRSEVLRRLHDCGLAHRRHAS